jgi:hypothetical protein
MLDRVTRIFMSVRLTVVLLALGLLLVFWGTLAQVEMGLYRAQDAFFRSFLIFERFPGLGFRLPFPGGYTIGGLMLINLFLAHFRYYQPGKRKYGIVMIHAGLVLLIAGQFLTDILAKESNLHLRDGESKNYSESSDQFELAIVDKSAADSDHVVAIDGRRLQRDREVRHADLPFAVQVKTYHANSLVTDKPAAGFTAVEGAGIWWRGLPHVTEMDKRDMPSAIVELVAPQESPGTFFVSGFLTGPQTFTHQGRRYEIALRQVRFYKPFTMHLIEFRHDKYPGTEIPKNFSSRVRLERPATGENREVLIYMNNPLRYEGETYYQSSFDPDNRGTVLQVVRNPSWLTPYFACVVVGLGLLWQFAQHLVAFARKRQ